MVLVLVEIAVKVATYLWIPQLIMEEAVDQVKKMLHDNFKRKHSESSEIGKSPKRKSLHDELVLPEDTPEWGKQTVTA